jgi:hypothetical protein
MKNVIFAIAVLFFVTACHAGYGPIEDHSAFVSARLADDQRTVLFAFHRYAYRPATGWRAFPDGGIPDYLTDSNLLGVYDLRTREVRIVHREDNHEWQPGSGTFTIHLMNGSMALIAQGGQLRGPFRLAGKHLLLDIKRNKISALDLKSDLAKYGRDTGQIHMVDPDGTLVFVTLSLEEAEESRAYRNRRLTPEIWVRTPAGDYLKAATSAHYERTRNGEVIYWEPATREFMAFSIAERATRKAPEFKVPDYEDVTEGVILSSDHKALEFGVKADGQWKYQRLDLNPEMLQ